uniref:Uncharacterized protein n=1 Tax=Amphimedon queenslandica TaxID=400682 RepID=A0A1X7UZI0_AMPQE
FSALDFKLRDRSTHCCHVASLSFASTRPHIESTFGICKESVFTSLSIFMSQKVWYLM